MDRRKREIEIKILQIEKAMEIFNKPIVYVAY